MSKYAGYAVWLPWRGLQTIGRRQICQAADFSEAEKMPGVIKIVQEKMILSE